MASQVATSSRIIKQRHSPRGAAAYAVVPRPSGYDRALALELVRDAQARAAAIVAQARAQAEAIREATQAELDAHKEAWQTAIREQARAETRAALTTEMDGTNLRFQQLVEQAFVAADQLRAACYADLLTLAVAIAERVIGAELKADPGVVERVVALALDQVPLERVISVMAHPDDVAVVERWAGPALGDARRAIEIVADSAVGPGGCVIGTKTGFIDARIETQLAEVRRALADVVEHA